MAFLSGPRENDGSVCTQKCPSQASLRSPGARCRQSHALSLPTQRMVRMPRLPARCRAPIVTPAMRPCGCSINKPFPSGRLLAVCTCPDRQCINFWSPNPFPSEAARRIKEAFSISTSPTSSNVGRQGVGMVPSYTRKSKHVATPAQ